MPTILSALRSFFSTLALLLFFLPPAAASPVLADSDPKFYPSGPTAKEIINQAKEVTAQAFPDADSVVLSHETFVRYTRNGLYQQWDEAYIKILTEKGRRDEKNISSHFTIPYNTTRFESVEIIRNGQTTAVDIAAVSREMIEPGQMQANIYNPNDKILVLTLPDLQVGDILHYVIFDDFQKARVPGTFSDIMVLEDTRPILFSRARIVGPKKLPLTNIQVKDEKADTLTFAHDMVRDLNVWTWTARNVPQAFPEPDMPPFYTVAQRVLVSTIPDWEWLSRWYWELSLPALEKTTPEMRSLVHELTAKTQTRREALVSIFTWVSQKIRYMGLTLEETAPGYEPHPVDMTFNRRAGVCRDKAALLTAMLRLAEFEAFPVLIMNGPRKDPEVPQPFFNHAIVAVRQETGSFELMDPTDESTLQLLPPYLNNQSYLVATPWGEPLRTSPVIPASENMMLFSTNATLSAEGTLSAQTACRFLGINDNAYRGFLSRLDAEQQKSVFESLLRQTVPGAIMQKFTLSPSDMQDVSTPLKVELSFSAIDQFVPAGDRCLFRPPSFGRHLGMTRFLIDKTGLQTRRFPLFTHMTCGFDEKMHVSAPDIIFAYIPGPKSESTPGTAWSRNATASGNRLVVRENFQLLRPGYSPSEYQDLRRVLAEMEQGEKSMISCCVPEKEQALGKDDAPNDVRVLESRLEVDIQDAHSWTETETKRMKILTYAGKKAQSELKFEFNPAWEDIHLEKAVVIDPEGREHTPHKHEINVMDADWVGRAPAYSPVKTMVVSLPGVEAGSTITYRVKRKKWDRPFFSLRRTLQESDPVDLAIVAVRCPADLRLRVLPAPEGIGLDEFRWRSQRPDIQHQASSKGGRTIHTFTARSLPAVARERQAAPLYTFCPTVLLTAGSWDTLARELKKTLDQLLEKVELPVDRVRTLRAAGTRDEILAAVRDFVASSIQSAGPGLNQAPWSELSPPGTTLARGYGHSGDQALLLASLLKACGLETGFALPVNEPKIRSIQDGLLQSPDWSLFDQILVTAKDSRGRTIYLNDTSQYAPLGATSSAHTLALDPESAHFVTVQPPSPDLNEATQVVWTIRLDNDGSAHAELRREYFGPACEQFRRRMREMTPEKIRRYAQEQVSAVSRLAVQKNPVVLELQGPTAREVYSLSLPEFALPGEDSLILDLPGLITGIEGTQLQNRETPLLRPDASTMAVRLQIIPPKDFALVLAEPRSTNISLGPWGRITTQVRQESKGITIQQKSELIPMVVCPDRYPALRDAAQSLALPASTTLVLGKSDQTLQ